MTRAISPILIKKARVCVDLFYRHILKKPRIKIDAHISGRKLSEIESEYPYLKAYNYSKQKSS